MAKAAKKSATKSAKKAPARKGKVSAAVGVAVARGGTKTPVTSAAERAMSEAIAECQRRGETDPAKIRAAMLAARDKSIQGE